MNNIELKEMVVSTLNGWLEKYFEYFSKKFEVETPEELVDLYGFGYVYKDNKVIYICNGRDEILKSHLNARQIWERIQKTREEPYKERNILYCLFFNAK
jgi:hypothetical protein